MAGIFGAADLAELQSLKRLTMTGTAAVLSQTRVEGPGGTSTVEWLPKEGLSGLACGFAFDTPTEALGADAVQAVARCRVDFQPADLADTAGITAADRLAITHTVPGVASPLVLAVIGEQPRGSDEVVRVVRAERVRG